jgi:hypothetical protein
VNGRFIEITNTNKCPVFYSQIAYLKKKKKTCSTADGHCPLLEVGSGRSHPDSIMGIYSLRSETHWKDDKVF